MSTDPLATTDGGIPPPPRLPDYSPTPLRYQLLRLHAKGALGEVHVAHDRELGREVALKLMQAHVADHPDLRKRFLLEAEVTGNLEHPGIVPVYGLGVDDKGRAYYAMRLIKGESLLEAIAHFHAAGGDHSQTIRHLMGRFVAVCQAVAYAHSRGILHRDLKPANVMLGPYGETLVVDWGLARPVARSEGDRSLGEDTLTPRPDHQPGATRGVVGSPAYMSPEQAGGLHSQVGPASDVYGLGATLYALLTGEPPFAGTTLDEVLEKVQRGEFLRPRLRNKAVPPALEAVCLKAMALRREDRYPNAADLGRDVEAWLADEPVSAWKEPLSERLRRWVKRRRTAVASTLAAGAVALVVMTAATLLLRTAYVKESDARGDAERESKRAERGLQVAQETNATLLELAEELKPAPGLQVRVLDRVLGRASRRYDELRRVAGDR